MFDAFLQVIRNCSQTRDAQMRAASLLAAVLALSAMPTARADEPSFTLIIQNHKFEPERTEVPAGQKFRLVVKNLDSTAEEFESRDLKREKMIAGGREAMVMLGPLDAGTYRFTGEYHEATAKGVLVAK